jgi:hypothetical protein
MMLAVPAWAATSSQATQTSLSAQSIVQGGRTKAVVSVAVVGQDSKPASGAVVIDDEGKSLAGAALSAEGQARIELSLPPGDHSLRRRCCPSCLILRCVGSPRSHHRCARFSGFGCACVYFAHRWPVWLRHRVDNARQRKRAYRADVRHPVLLRLSRSVFVHIHA